MINKFITNTLKPCGLSVYFSTRKENSTPCIVFNVVESPGEFSDDKEDLTEYTVLLNVYISSDRYVDTIEIVKQLMAAAGFVKKQIPSAMWDETIGKFNQPMEYKIFK